MFTPTEPGTTTFPTAIPRACRHGPALRPARSDLLPGHHHDPARGGTHPGHATPIRDFVRPQDGAKCAGIHLEGPFLSYAKRGAQAADNLHKPDVAMFRRLNEASGGQVRLITVAPEEDGCLPFIEEVSKECTVSLGHTTAGYDLAMEAFRAGANHATHLYNGMPPLNHREPGVIGAALDAGAAVELICDGMHIHPSVIRATHRMFGEQLVLISDSMRCADMPDGDYELGGQPVELHSGRATLKGTDTGPLFHQHAH